MKNENELIKALKENNADQMADAIMDEIKTRARTFARDNMKRPTDFEVVMIESAMFIGALIGIMAAEKAATEVSENK